MSRFAVLITHLIRSAAIAPDSVPLTHPLQYDTLSRTDIKLTTANAQWSLICVEVLVNLQLKYSSPRATVFYGRREHSEIKTDGYKYGC
jgi:hypothetical protein